MKKLLNIAMCIALGLAVAGCETAPVVEETPTVEVEVSGEAVEITIPDETMEVITEAIETAEGGEETTEEVTE